MLDKFVIFKHAYIEPSMIIQIINP